MGDRIKRVVFIAGELPVEGKPAHDRLSLWDKTMLTPLPLLTPVSRQGFVGNFPMTYVLLARDKVIRPNLQRALRSVPRFARTGGTRYRARRAAQPLSGNRRHSAQLRLASRQIKNVILSEVKSLGWPWVTPPEILRSSASRRTPQNDMLCRNLFDYVLTTAAERPHGAGTRSCSGQSICLVQRRANLFHAVRMPLASYGSNVGTAGR